MVCLIIGIIWVCLRFLATLLVVACGAKVEVRSTCLVLLWFIGWLANIALLIIGACSIG